jgi:hypothetical protein
MIMVKSRQRIQCFVFGIITLLLLCCDLSGVKSADAATVYGRVVCPKSVSCPNRITLEIYQGDRLITALRTDTNRDYRVFLNKGQYQVVIKLDTQEYSATIRSASNPIRQDIHLQRSQ